MLRLSALVAFTAILGFSTASSAVPLTQEQVPAPLKPWIQWVSHDIEHNTCPFTYNDQQEHSCMWPTRLSLNLMGKGGTFSYTVTIYDAPDLKPQRIDLPGDKLVWPQNVKVNGQSGVVLSTGEYPFLQLRAGNYTITGSYAWDNLPTGMQVPSNIGLVDLTLNGHSVSTVDINGDQLWIQRNDETKESTQENHLESKLFRKITDDIPQHLDTFIRLQVAGKQREEALGKILPPGFIATSVESDLPARLEQDGELKAQLRPGTWEIHITARAAEPFTTLALPERNGILPTQEIWSFEGQNQLRLTQVEGVGAIDPSQTEIPAEWQNLPAYLIKPDSHFTLVEKKRGISQSVPDQLNLSRIIRLDFSGDGYSFEDSINGAIHQSSRLEAASGITLGNASIDGKSQYITTLAEGDKKSLPGVEVREGYINMTASSRLDSGASTFSATGWKNSFDHMNASLYLPQGWTLFSYSGVDYVSNSWVGSWSLLDVFFVLITTVSVYKLFHPRLALLTLACLTLVQHELPGFTQLVLLALITIAILRYLPTGKFRIGVIWAQRLLLAIIILSSVSFMAKHLREAIYPQLQTQRQVYAQGGGWNGIAQEKEAGSFGMAGAPAVLPESAPVDELNAPLQSVRAPQARQHMMRKKIMHLPMANSDALKAAGKSTSSLSSQISSYQEYAPDTKVQTGFGSSNWSGNAIELRWNGAVDPTVKLSLYLISAHENLVLTFLRVILMVWLLAWIFGVSFIHVKDKWLGSMTTTGAWIILFALAGFAPHSAQAQSLAEQGVFPPQPLLQELRTKLTQSLNEPASCLPYCASVARAHVQISGDTLLLLEEIHAGTNVVVPLPGGVANWRPSSILVDDKPAAAIKQGQNKYLQINLTSGVHQVKMVGLLPAGRDTIGISLPMQPYFTTVDAQGWDVQGVHENGIADNSLQLLRTAKQQSVVEKSFGKTIIEPFFQVDRTFELGAQWKLTTVVRRVTSADQPAAVSVPLLAGETVTTADLHVKDGAAFVNFNPGEEEVTWQSVIAPGPALKLTAAKGKPWVEIWRMSVSNLWHANPSGISRVYFSDPATAAVNSARVNSGGMWQWQPWPGETLTVDALRPEGVDGDTRTLEASTLHIAPGQRSMEMTLNASMKSSLGGQQDITLPEGAILLDVTKGGQVLPLQLKQNMLSLPLAPGDNEFAIRWKQDDALSTVFETPAVHTGLSHSVNATTLLQMPQDRWLLFAMGPQMGPAVLFWSWIPIILILSYVLGKLPVTPLRMPQWFLLLLGLSQMHIESDIIIIAWIIALGARAKMAEKPMPVWCFDLMQLALVLLTILGLGILFNSITMGLLGTPDMRIMGNNSYAYLLHWYQDITGPVLSQPLVISVPVWAYRILMLFWALWLAFSLVSWLRWGWQNFMLGGYWRKV